MTHPAFRYQDRIGLCNPHRQYIASRANVDHHRFAALNQERHFIPMPESIMLTRPDHTARTATQLEAHMFTLRNFPGSAPMLLTASLLLGTLSLSMPARASEPKIRVLIVDGCSN